MAKGSSTSLFISSTCYDLEQVRSNLRDFALSLGFKPIMSEYDSFPVNPEQAILNNCLEVVRDNADIFLLVVGGRYGSITGTGKSITNLEYHEACATGIPKYVFVKQDILSLLPIWKANKEADFTAVVDTPKLFEFVSSIREAGDTWVFPFNDAKDIVETLRKQFSFLLSESLELRKKLADVNVELCELQAKSLRLAIEKPEGWEYLLFAQVLQERIEDFGSKRLDAELGISFGEPIALSDIPDVTSWAASRLDWMSHIVSQLENAINSGFSKAVGEPGEPGNIRRIVHLAARVSDAYARMLDWKLQFVRVNVEGEFERLLFLLSEFASSALRDIEKFSTNLYSTLKSHMDNDHKYKDGSVITITLTISSPKTDEFNQEIQRLVKLFRGA